MWLNSWAFSLLELTGSKVLASAASKSLSESQTVVFLLHSAEAQVLALPVRWEILNATFDRSVGNPWGKNSK